MRGARRARRRPPGPPNDPVPPARGCLLREGVETSSRLAASQPGPRPDHSDMGTRRRAHPSHQGDLGGVGHRRDRLQHHLGRPAPWAQDHAPRGRADRGRRPLSIADGGPSFSGLRLERPRASVFPERFPAPSGATRSLPIERIHFRCVPEVTLAFHPPTQLAPEIGHHL